MTTPIKKTISTKALTDLHHDSPSFDQEKNVNCYSSTGVINPAFNPGEGSVANAGLRSELASSTGADIIGYGDRTIAESLNSLFNTCINIKEFGAKGDGSSDDTEALNAALAASLQQGMPLFWPDGNYYITSDIVIKRKIITSGFVNIIGPDIGDTPPIVSIYFARRMDVVDLIFKNINVIIAPESDSHVYTPAFISRNLFLSSTLTLGQDRVMTSGYSITHNGFTSRKSRATAALKLINTNLVNIHDNEMQEFATGIMVAPTMSFTTHQISIKRNRISHCSQSSIYLQGTSMYRIAKIEIAENSINGSIREARDIRKAGILALFCVDLSVLNNTISYSSDCLKMEAVLGAVIDSNSFLSTAGHICVRANSCIDTFICRNNFVTRNINSYSMIIGGNTLNPLTKYNTYYSARLTISDNIFDCYGHGIKVENSESITIQRNKFNSPNALTAQGFIWFAGGTKKANYYDNQFYAPSGIPIRNDVHSEVTSLTSSQTLIVTPVNNPVITPPIITDSDNMLNYAKSYVTLFSVDNAMQIRHLADDDSPKPLSEWMSTVPEARLGWNASAWNVNMKTLADIIVNGISYDNYDTEYFWWARSVMFIDLYNRLTCRDFATSKYTRDIPLMISAASISERAWQTAAFRPPLVVDGEIYNPIATGLITEQGYYSELSAHTCLGQKSDGTYILLVVDGKSGEYGSTMQQVANKMLSLGCINAYNLDGGGSTTLWYNGTVINSPSDENGERPLPSVMYI